VSRKLQVLSSTELRTYNLGLATFDQYYLCFIGIFLLEFAKIVKEPFLIANFQFLIEQNMSQITTHVLDTSLGKPAEGIRISLQKTDGSSWETIGSGLTNSDGRVANLLAEDVLLEPGIYRMFFETGPYYKGLNIQTFYPEASIVFETFDTEHYHVPLLLNPFGYSTYRGS